MNCKLLPLILLTFALLVPAILGTQPTYAETQGKTYTVNVQTDGTDALPNGTCETLPGSGICSLRAALQEANSVASPGADTIKLPTGTFVLERPGQDDTALNGDLDILEDVTISGKGAGLSSIDGNGGVTFDRVFEIAANVQVNISGVAIRHGHAAEGGGIYNGGALLLTHSIVEQNLSVALGGAGILNRGTAALVNSAVQGNTSTIGGGGIHNAAGEMTITQSVIKGNTGQDSGGGIANNGKLRIVNSTVSGNTSEGAGGGIATNKEATLINSTVTGNAAKLGGGVWIDSGGTSNLYNVTVANNRADKNNTGENENNGGGVRVENNGGAHLWNSILANNKLERGIFDSDNDCASVVVLHDYNLVGTTSGCALFGDNDTNVKGAAAQLGTLEDNGGPTRTHAPLAGSPVIDAGNANGCRDDADETLSGDQRGFVRAVDGGSGTARCDIGAVEYGADPLPPQCNAKPDKATLKKPTDGSVVSTVRVKLNWNDVPSADTYKVRVRQDGKHGPSADKKNGLTKSKYKTDPIDPGHTHYWRVLACNQHGCKRSSWKTFILE